jgi:hypothetical protein
MAKSASKANSASAPNSSSPSLALIKLRQYFIIT